MKRALMIFALTMVLHSPALADIFVQPTSLMRLVFFTKLFVLYIETSPQVCLIDESTSVAFSPPTSGTFLGKWLDSDYGLYAFGILWPSLWTGDEHLDITLTCGEQGVSFSIPARPNIIGGER